MLISHKLFAFFCLTSASVSRAMFSPDFTSTICSPFLFFSVCWYFSLEYSALFVPFFVSLLDYYLALFSSSFDFCGNFSTLFSFQSDFSLVFSLFYLIVSLGSRHFLFLLPRVCYVYHFLLRLRTVFITLSWSRLLIRVNLKLIHGGVNQILILKFWRNFANALTFFNI